MKNTPIISLKGIQKVFRETPTREVFALRDITFSIQSGEFFVIIGPSGSGKSTLLRIMSGFERSFEGECLIAGDVKEREMSFVFQQFALFPWLTVSENIAFGLVAGGMPEVTQKKIVAKELRQFGLQKFAHSYPRELSGGMRQRVGIARALAVNPKIIFMDEPFSELDSFTAETLRQELLSVWRERKITIVMVTHLIEEAIELADRIAVLTPRPGTIEAIIRNPLARPRVRRSDAFYKLEDKLYRLLKP